VAEYINTAPFEEKSDSWQSLAERAGVVKEYTFEKGRDNVQFHPGTIQWHVTDSLSE
jgi:hypothetical protein